MKNTLNKSVITVLCVLASVFGFSQQTNKPATTNTKPTQYISVWGGTGYSLFLNNSTNIKDLGGLGAELGVGYELQMNKFHVSSGLEFNLLNSKSNIFNYAVTRQMLLPYPTMTYHYAFSDYTEKWNAGYLNIPILLSYDFGKRYFATIGTKIGVGLMGNYASTGTVTMYATDSEIIDDLTGMPNHNLSVNTFSGNGNVNFSMNVAATAEFGVNLDEWLAVKQRPLRRGQRPRPKTFRESLHYRASAFVDYGLMNINDYAKNQTANGIIPNFVGDQSPLVSNLNSALSSQDYASQSVNPLFVGVKFAVLYEIPKKVVKRRPPARPTAPVVVPKKPVVQQPPVVEVVPLLCGVTVDSESKIRISANIELFSEDGSVSVYKGTSDALKGVFSTQLKAGTYMSHITAQGYLPYDEKIVFVKDTLTIPLQKAKQGVKVVLKNIFFAFNKTNILPESDETLEDLYNFLKENPYIRIRITGHTDNVGSAESNLKLSEERAKSVMNYIIAKGISADRISYEGKGESEPCATNDTEEGRAENRRVEFTIL